MRGIIPCSNAHWSLALLIVLAAHHPACGDEAFVPLFDGESLQGWIGPALEHFEVKGGVLTCREGCTGKLLTKEQYGDFVLRFEFKLSPGANNGLAIRAPIEGDAAYVGIELQILDNSAEAYRDLKDYQFHGSAYGIAAAKRGALNPVGSWNTQEVVCQGSRVRVELNGETILDIDLEEEAPGGKTIDGAEHPGLRRDRGYLGFLCHEDRVWFRNIRLKDLSYSPRQTKN